MQIDGLTKKWAGPAVIGVLLGAAALLSPGAGAQTRHKTHKCLVDGRTVYQQTACAANATSDVASAAASSPGTLPAAARRAPAARSAASAAAVR